MLKTCRLHLFDKVKDIEEVLRGSLVADLFDKRVPSFRFGKDIVDGEVALFFG